MVVLSAIVAVDCPLDVGVVGVVTVVAVLFVLVVVLVVVVCGVVAAVAFAMTSFVSVYYFLMLRVVGVVVVAGCAVIGAF